MFTRRGRWYKKYPKFEESNMSMIMQHPDLKLSMMDLQVDTLKPTEDQNELLLFFLCIGGESRGEPDDGIKAVAEVIYNRATVGGWWGDTIRDVILKKNEDETIYQFSSMNPKDPNRAWLVNPDAVSLSKIARLCLPIYFNGGNVVSKQTFHFHNVRIKPPSWTNTMKLDKMIGDHIFYSGR
jgi:spore germination cell wall hydrolase CwlJ-like protein